MAVQRPQGRCRVVDRVGGQPNENVYEATELVEGQSDLRMDSHFVYGTGPVNCSVPRGGILGGKAPVDRASRLTYDSNAYGYDRHSLTAMGSLAL
jgi:hypothetical protein